MTENSSAGVVSVRSDRRTALDHARMAESHGHSADVASWSAAIALQCRIIGAVLMRDMKTRFGRSYLAYVIAILWPLSHLLVLLTIFTLVTKHTPIGSNATVFVASGILPYILCLYPARQMTFAVAANQPLLLFPVVKTTDLIIARAILEVLTAAVVVALFALILYLFDIDFMPLDPFVAATAVCVSILLGMGFGFSNIVGYALFKQAWIIVSIIMQIVMYITSGVMWLPSSLPERVRDLLWFNPLLHAVEWLRSAYYEGYGETMLSKPYVIGVAVFWFLIGILGDRFLRGRLQQP